MSQHITLCGSCRQTLQPGDRVLTAPISPGRARMRKADENNDVMQALGDAEYDLVHRDCQDPRLGRMSVDLRRNVPYDRCARCRLAIQQGDRVVTCFIVQSTGMNPNLPSLELQTCLGTDMELAHADCRDPKLTGSQAASFRSVGPS